MGPFGLIEDQSCCCILNHLLRFNCVCWKSCQKSIAIVQPRNDKGLDKKFCSMLCQIGPAISDVV